MKSTRTLVSLFLAILSVWVLAGSLVFWSFDEWGDRGSFGDMFGAVNSLFSGLAFAGILLALYFQTVELETQRQELELQREELAAQREELRRAAVAQEQSNDALALQARVLRTTARLSALGSLVDSYGKMATTTQIVSEQKNLSEIQNKYTSQLELELDELS